MSDDGEINIIIEKLRLIEVRCEKCGKHSGWALVCVHFVCDECNIRGGEKDEK